MTPNTPNKRSKSLTNVYRPVAEQKTADAAWHQPTLPVWMKLTRLIRPIIFKIAVPVLQAIRRRNGTSRLLGLQFHTDADVFHPKFFFSGRILAQHLLAKDLSGKQLVDMGTGSGIVGIHAAKSGASVLALDISRAAVLLATSNAERNGLNGEFVCRQSDLFENVEPEAQFDLIAFNPPFFAGEPRTAADAAWYAGEDFSTIDRFLQQSKEHLTSDGQVVFILSSDMPLTLLNERFQQHGYRVCGHTPKAHLFEMFHLVELNLMGCDEVKRL